MSDMKAIDDSFNEISSSKNKLWDWITNYVPHARDFYILLVTNSLHIRRQDFYVQNEYVIHSTLALYVSYIYWKSI